MQRYPACVILPIALVWLSGMAGISWHILIVQYTLRYTRLSLFYVQLGNVLFRTVINVYRLHVYTLTDLQVKTYPSQAYDTATCFTHHITDWRNINGEHTQHLPIPNPGPRPCQVRQATKRYLPPPHLNTCPTACYSHSTRH
ncbi:hypothetical protein V8C86DRAFT_78540 [Haematococcus lacustris]